MPFLPSVPALGDILLCASRHVIYVFGNQVMVVNDPESQSPITMLLSWLEVRPCVRYLEDFNHLVPNQRYVSNERVGEWTNFFRVSSKHRMPTENRSPRNYILIVCKVLASISTVHGVTCGNRSYQIIPQPIAEGLSIYFMKILLYTIPPFPRSWASLLD